MAIKKISINIAAYIKSYLPAHWRQANRLKLFELLLSPFTVLMSEYIVWRNQAITQANVSNEKIVLEWYLNSLFDPSLKRIYILRRNITGVEAGLSGAEPSYYVEVGLSGTEPSYYVETTLSNEDANIGLYDFGVFIPTSLSSNSDAIKSILVQYSKANKNFGIFLI